MKVVTTIVYGSSVKKDYNIYERVEEIEEHGIDVKSLDDAEPGDYVKSDNGFYIPLLHKTVKRHPKNRELAFYNYYFPRYAYNRIRNCKEDYFFSKTFSYPTEPQQYLAQNLSAEKRLVAVLLGNGVAFHNALAVAYPEKYLWQRQSIGKKLMENKRFIKFLIGKTDVKKLLESLEDNGVDYEYLAQSLKKHIDSGKDGLEAIKFGFTLNAHAIEAEELKKKELPDKNDLSKIGFTQKLLDKKRGHK